MKTKYKPQPITIGTREYVVSNIDDIGFTESPINKVIKQIAKDYDTKAFKIMKDALCTLGIDLTGILSISEVDTAIALKEDLYNYFGLTLEVEAFNPIPMLDGEVLKTKNYYNIKIMSGARQVYPKEGD